MLAASKCPPGNFDEISGQKQSQENILLGNVNQNITQNSSSNVL